MAPLGRLGQPKVEHLCHWASGAKVQESEIHSNREHQQELDFVAVAQCPRQTGGASVVLFVIAVGREENTEEEIGLEEVEKGGIVTEKEG